MKLNRLDCCGRRQLPCCRACFSLSMYLSMDAIQGPVPGCKSADQHRSSPDPRHYCELRPQGNPLSPVSFCHLLQLHGRVSPRLSPPTRQLPIRVFLSVSVAYLALPLPAASLRVREGERASAGG